VGAVRTNALPDGWYLTPLIAFAGTLASVIGFLAFADLVGQSQLVHEGSDWLVRVAFIESLVAAVLSLPVLRVVSWAAAGTTGARRLRSVGAGVAA
jgi:hypothetical protein